LYMLMPTLHSMDFAPILALQFCWLTSVIRNENRHTFRSLRRDHVITGPG